ncbi:MAG: hypothetical protein AB8B81_20020 [Halioglobus sp.]
MRQWTVAITFGVIFGLALPSPTWAEIYVPSKNRPNQQAPDAIGLFMANGVFDPADTTYIAPSGADFDRVIMGRTEGEAEARRLEAVNFFIERYGIDLTNGVFSYDPVQGLPDVVLSQAYQDPRWNYRAFSLPDRPAGAIPPDGSIVHDTQWVMLIIAPAGLTLHGSWGGPAGKRVPPGTVAVDGEYLVQGTSKFRRGHPKNFYARFQSTTPILSAASTAGTPQGIKFDCRVFHEELGTGVALGRQELHFLSTGELQVNIGNVIQFPAPQWAMEQDEVLGPTN